MLYIRGLNDTFFKNTKGNSGNMIRLSSSHAQVSKDSITFDALDLPTVQSSTRIGPRSMGTTIGTRKVLAVRVVSLDSASPASELDLARIVFGHQGASPNMVETFRACSFGQLTLQPGTFAPFNGVETVQINQNAVGANLDNFYGAVLSILNQKYPVNDLGSIFDNVLLCLPPVFNFYAFALMWFSGGVPQGGWLSVYNGNACLAHGALMHENGHCLRLSHSGEGSDEYGDHTCFMGNGGIQRGCYNGPKSFQLGWYSSQAQTLNILNMNGASSFTLVGIADYQKINSVQSNSQKAVVLKLEAGDADYFVLFNRKTGINADVEEYGDQIVVTSQQNYDNSWIQKTLRTTGQCEPLLLPSGQKVFVCINEINLASDPAYAKVTIKQEGGDTDVSPTYGDNWSDGANKEFKCPDGQVLTNLSAKTGGLIDQLTGKCGDGTRLGPLGGTGGSTIVTAPDCATGYTGATVRYTDTIDQITLMCGATAGPTIGTDWGGTVASFTCPSVTKVFGFGGNEGFYSTDQQYFVVRNFYMKCSQRMMSPTYGDNWSDGVNKVFNCPDGQPIINLSGRTGLALDQLNGKCGDGTTLGPLGGTGGGPVTGTDCPTGYTGATVRYGNFVEQITLMCGAIASTSIGPQYANSVSTFTCPSGTKVSGFGGNEGLWTAGITVVRNLYIKCSPLNVRPSSKPVAKPSSKPTPKPTNNPVAKPTRKPTPKPTSNPVAKPLSKPTPKPTSNPVTKPFSKPPPKPTNNPVAKPTWNPTRKPTKSIFITQTYGGTAGTGYTLYCTGGAKLVNMSGRAGSQVNQLVGKCVNVLMLGPTGGSSGTVVTTSNCSQGFTGGTITYGTVVGKISLTCGTTSGFTIIGGGQGIGSGTIKSFLCPSGLLVSGFGGKTAGTLVASSSAK